MHHINATVVHARAGQRQSAVRTTSASAQLRRRPASVRVRHARHATVRVRVVSSQRDAVDSVLVT